MGDFWVHGMIESLGIFLAPVPFSYCLDGMLLFTAQCDHCVFFTLSYISSWFHPWGRYPGAKVSILAKIMFYGQLMVYEMWPPTPLIGRSCSFYCSLSGQFSCRPGDSIYNFNQITSLCRFESTTIPIPSKAFIQTLVPGFLCDPFPLTLLQTHSVPALWVLLSQTCKQASSIV